MGSARPLRSLSAFGLPPQLEIRDVKDRVCFLCYSSGTTGRPKGVELTHYGIVAVLEQMFESEKALSRPDEVYIAVLPLYHVLALVIILCQGVHLGYTIVIQPKFELEKAFTSFFFPLLC